MDKKCTTPGERVPAGDGCNSCVCNDDGTLGACTLKGCVSAILPLKGKTINAS